MYYLGKTFFYILLIIETVSSLQKIKEQFDLNVWYEKFLCDNFITPAALRLKDFT